MSEPVPELDERGAPRTSMVRDCEPEEDRPTVAPPPAPPPSPPTSIDRAAEQSATTQLGAWQVVADLLANVQRDVATVANLAERRRLQSDLRPLARAVTHWQTVAPHPAQSKTVLERLLEIQDELSELETG